MKKIFICLLVIFVLCGCMTKQNANSSQGKSNETNTIVLDGQIASINGNQIKEYDYVRTISPDSEDEIFNGDQPSEDEKIYIAHDIVYYPKINEDRFVKENYDGETEWVCHYTNEELKDYLFSTLPVLGNELPTQMMHSENEAYENPVLHICEAGEYILQGNWHGQIWIDLKEDVFNDETKKVTIILNGVNVVCDVAPALVFYNVYESDNLWEEREEYTNNIDITNAGAKVIIVDGTENNFTGANVFRLLKPTYKKEGSTVQKKRWKMDGAFYSYESLLIEGQEKGTGILNITSTTFEGLDSELHLTINSGYINIVSQDDGINVNEDNVSVFTMNGGRLTIFAAQGAEGDVVDSNGFIKVNGGTILGTTPSGSDEILDSEKGVEISENALVISSGNMKNNMPMGREFFGEIVGDPPVGGFGDRGPRPDLPQDQMENGQRPPEIPGEQPKPSE